MRSESPWRELVRAIQAAPADDAPRLVAADWLMERDEPRGEHVALQIQRAARGPGADPALAARLAAIDPRPWLDAIAALGARGVRPADELVLERGFVEFAALAGDAVANTGALLRREPITALELGSGGPGPSARAAAAPDLAGLRWLRLAGRYGSGHTAITRSPHLVDLHTLVVDDLLEVQVAGLADTGLRPRCLRASPRPAAARALAESRVLERVEELHGGMIGEAALIELARAPLTALRALTVDSWEVGAGGLRALGPRLGQLRVLRYPGPLLDRAALELVAEHAGNLRELDLPYLPFDIDAILDSGALDRLQVVGLRGARFSHRALRRFLARSDLRRAEGHADDDIFRLTHDDLCEVFPGLDLTRDNR